MRDRNASKRRTSEDARKGPWPGSVRDGRGILGMTRKDAARQRKRSAAARPRKPPTLREIVETREKGYHEA